MTAAAYKTSDIVAEILGMGGLKIEDMLQRLRKLFPDASQDQIERAFAIAREELEHRAKEAFDEAYHLTQLKEYFKGLPAGTTFDEAVKIRAKEGNPAAIAYLAAINSIPYRLRTALFDAAIDHHPDWERGKNGFKWIGEGPRPDFLDEDTLVEWFQTRHPAQAREIERRFEGVAS